MEKMSRGGTITNIENSVELANILNYRMKNKMGGANQRLGIMLGMYSKDKENPIKANIPSQERSRFSQERYKFFLDAPFEISNKCCTIMKKEPAHRYHRETGRNPILGTMAQESQLRAQKWLQNGCNGFNLKIPTSNPMSFWTEQDVLTYIKENNIPICSVYGDIVIDYKGMGQLDNQLSLVDYGIDKESKPLLKTTGCTRTGCVLCGFGCHLEKESRFVALSKSHPGLYTLMDKMKNNGVTYKEAIDWINENGGFNIKY